MGHQRTILEKGAEANRKNVGTSLEPLSPPHASVHPLLYLQRKVNNQAALYLQRSSDNSPGIQKKCAGCGKCPECAEEEVIQRKPLYSTTTPLIQRQDNEPIARAESPSPILIVEDSVEQLQSGQMRKSEFLDQLHSAVCGAAEEALAGTMWSAMGCPYIDRWLSHYSTQSSQHLERALHKYAPETAGASSARDYIPLVTQRVRRGIEQWRETGEVTGVPAELAQGGMPGVTAGALLGGLVGGALSAVGSAVSSVVSGVGEAISGVGRALFKGREGGVRGGEDPTAIQAELGSGHSLGGDVKVGMEAAFGVDFSGVRIHTGAKAQALNEGLNARAFTVGRDVAFGAGEYQPGTPVGDALIAHELAHVMQQGGASSSTGPMTKSGADYGALEEEADISAVGAVVSLWGGVKGALGDIGSNAMPRLRSGLRLQSCGAEAAQKSSPEAATSGQKPTRLIDVPELRGIMAKMWTNSIAGGVVVLEYSIVVIRDTRTGRVTKVDSWEGKEVRPGEKAETNICLHPGFKLEPYEEVWGSVHTHPLLLSEAPPEPNQWDQGIVKDILSSKDATANCGTEHYVIAQDNNIYQFDGRSYWVVAERKASIGV